MNWRSPRCAPGAALPRAADGGLGRVALAIGTCGLAFTGIDAVTAQLASGARGARGLAIGVLGLSFLLRAIGDSAAPRAGLADLGIPAGLDRDAAAVRRDALVGAGTAARVVRAGDLGGVLAQRTSGSRGGATARPAGAGDGFGRAARSGVVAWRLQWQTLAGWAAGYVFIFAVCGAAAKGIGQLFGTSGALRTEFARIGGQSAIVNAYLAALMLLAGLVAAAYGVSTVLRLSSQETGQSADLILSGTVGRVRWALGHLLVAAFGMALLVVVAGVANGLGTVARGRAAPRWRARSAPWPSFRRPWWSRRQPVAAFGVVPRAVRRSRLDGVGAVSAPDLFVPSLQSAPWPIYLSPFVFASLVFPRVRLTVAVLLRPLAVSAVLARSVLPFFVVGDRGLMWSA